VSESNSTNKNHSLQLTGTGSAAADFAWQSPMSSTFGLPNTGQTFGAPDTESPAAPTGLAASAGDGQVDLDWDDNTEPDLDGYDVFRATTTGGPYSQLNGSPVGSSAYTDASASNGTTYYYVVQAVDTSGNSSGDSNEASATPQGGSSTPVHVDSIGLDTVAAGGPNRHGRATVIVVDDTGQPVSGATVTGTFTGDVAGTVNATTDASGVAVLVTNDKARGNITFSFCVDNVVKSGTTYDPAANVETCDSYSAS